MRMRPRHRVPPSPPRRPLQSHSCTTQRRRTHDHRTVRARRARTAVQHPHGAAGVYIGTRTRTRPSPPHSRLWSPRSRLAVAPRGHHRAHPRADPGDDRARGRARRGDGCGRSDGGGCRRGGSPCSTIPDEVPRVAPPSPLAGFTDIMGAHTQEQLALMGGVVLQMGTRVEGAAVASEPAWSERLEAEEGVYLNGVAQGSTSSPPVEGVTHSRRAPPEGDAKRPRRRMVFER
ncbi:hypothetical protein DFH07DRAFT_86377 [Mycena maculata]|uniref:Uncharacterized protein n=1 Tax=Mycena maculata TaxID=230809 RepID=A0AAD7I9L1_9AGAR|nr:hypothetical protein DFH07DRAFT_86377 [Mycena maculata]